MKIHHESHDLIMFFKPEFKYDIDTVSHFHWHENAEFLCILSEGFKILVDGILYETKIGDLIFIKEYAPHSFICENENVKMSLGQFSSSLLFDGCADIKPIKTHIKAEEIAKNPAIEDQLRHLLSIMNTFGYIKKNETKLFEKSIFSALYFMLMENFPEEKQDGNLKKERREFYRIIGYINENVTNYITVEKISQKLYIHRGKLSKIFSKYSGISINDYINNLRVSKANELLKNGSSVTEAALESGFQSVRTFSDVYKKKMGITPTEYIKNVH